MKKLLFLSSLIFISLVSCKPDVSDALFTKLSKSKTGVDFRNLIREDENFNIFKYQYFHNGGGLAVGDFNNDDLQDLVFTGNMVKNRLYVNKGNLKFKDVTKTSGIASKEGWCTGVTTVDINQDGWLDIYICRAGFPFEDLRENLLFINNGDLSFTEKAEEYGINDKAHSTHSAFFDYDRDGDLDLFILNHSELEYSRGSLEVFQMRKKRNPEFTNKLFRNDGGKFVNVTEEAGIFSNVLTFSLGISITDINDDQWPDIFVGNDFNEPDYLFINQGDGTFKDELETSFDHTSMFSMGSDVADFNNDGLLDIVSLDMLPESNYLQKMHSGADNYDKVALLEKNGFFKQYSRNMLQLNNGDGSFSEMGQLAGISNTDWSWAPLFFDFDNDGLKDLFIANGYLRDHTDMDFLNFTANEVLKIQRGEDTIGFEGYMKQMPPILLPNYFYHNQGNLEFVNKDEEWGLDEPVITQSAVYADLDNDGDHELVLNNTDGFAHIYRNNAQENSSNSFLKIKLKGTVGNPTGIGAKIRLYCSDEVFYQECAPVRGFQSTIDPNIIFGLGSYQTIDSVRVVWPTGELTQINDVLVNQTIELEIDDTSEKFSNQKFATRQYFEFKPDFQFSHSENQYDDFDIQPLLPWFFSRPGPCLEAGDLDNDGLEDIYLGNGQGEYGKILFQTSSSSNGNFHEVNIDGSEEFEDSDVVLFDANNDGLTDMYVASGSYEFPVDSPLLEDRLYINKGNRKLLRSVFIEEELKINTTCVVTTDFDKDGDNDLFVGGGYIHGRYPTIYNSYLLLNDGNGKFQKKELALADGGAVTDASWQDLNGDGFPELIVAGEWRPIQVLNNNNGTLVNSAQQYFEKPINGFWNTVLLEDFDLDGDADMIAGNLGVNSQLRTEENNPIEIYFGDFDENGSIDPIMTNNVEGELWPFPSRDDMINQLPELKRRFLFFKDYANAKIDDLLIQDQIAAASNFEVHTLETSYFENENGSFHKRPLTSIAQIAPVFDILSKDVNQDGNPDIILAGNLFHTRVKLGRLDGNHGLILLGQRNNEFTPVPFNESALSLRGEIRSLTDLDISGVPHLLIGANNENFKIYQSLQ